MPKFIIQGGEKLSGEIDVKGAKNAALKIIPASILSSKTIKITNVPQIEDIKRSLEVLADLGADIKENNSELEINTADIKKIELSPSLANKFRASIMFVAPLLARFGEVKFPHPGGCVIGAGSRPIDLFLEGFSALGAEISYNEEGFYHIKAKQLKGAEYFFTTVSVTGTESMLLASILADGVTTLKNCAMEPEITALAKYLNSQGAKIKGAGSPTMTITGVKDIQADQIEVIPDRIETGTFAIMAAISKSNITIRNTDPSHIEILLNIFKKIGIDFETGNDYLKILATKDFKSYGIKTHEYPGFSTDLQSPYTLLMTQAQGSAIIHELIYDRRLLFADMLCQMGANIIMCDPHRVVVNGPTPLFGKKLTSPDLRAGITMVLAGLIATGETEIDNIYQIERGYEKIEERLNALGAKIKKIN